MPTRTLLATLALSFLSVIQAEAADNNIFLPIASISPGKVTSGQPRCGSEIQTEAPAPATAIVNQLFTAYHITAEQRQFYVIEYVVPPALDGISDPANLWPHLMVGPWNHADKLQVDDVLVRLTCKGQLQLDTAQQALMSDWTAAYEKYVGSYPMQHISAHR